MSWLGIGGDDDEDGEDSAETGAEEPTDEWEWGTVVTPGGETIPPGACEGYHNKHNQTDRL